MNISFDGKKALVRVDFNVPLDEGRITDDTRMRAALPTIRKILDKGGAVILMSHLGRPQKKKTADGKIDRQAYTLEQVVNHLSELLGVDVKFSPQTVGEEALQSVQALRPGEVLLLENTRFHEGEKTGDVVFAKQLAELGDVYVNDAFGAAHREHASTATVAKFFDTDHKCFGLLMDKELTNARHVLEDAQSPVVAIIGGAKVSDKIGLLNQLLGFADHIIIGGAMAYTFIKAQGGKVGKSLVEEDKLSMAKELLSSAKEHNISIHLPKDSTVAEAFDAHAAHRNQASNEIPEEWMGLDIGEQSRKDFQAVITQAKTIIWNGPMGVFEMEPYAAGTKAIAQAVAEATDQGAFSLVGGGDSVAAVNQMGMTDRISHISTGGGAMLEFFEGKPLPGVKAME